MDFKAVCAAMEECQRLGLTKSIGLGSCWGSNHVFESKVLQEIAEEWGKTIAQVCIRWVYQAGATLAV
ncbi:hypothetical protein FF2_002756 [Malus domestica]